VWHLETIGVGAGWSCWEVGAGGGSIAEWLARRVGPTGSVLATDIDAGRMRAPESPQLTVARHNVVDDAIPERAYDLVHARLVLVHLAERERVLRSLVGALRPGGWILIEDFDNVVLDGTFAVTPEQQTVRRIAYAFRHVLEDTGADTIYARALPDLLALHDLHDIAGEARLVLGAGGSDAAGLLASNYAQAGAAMVRRGLCTEPELAAALRLLDDRRFVVATPLLFSVRGRTRGMNPLTTRSDQDPAT